MKNNLCSEVPAGDISSCSLYVYISRVLQWWRDARSARLEVRVRLPCIHGAIYLNPLNMLEGMLGGMFSDKSGGDSF